jgi:glycosyltransferase involved in cell wall biosynthesis
MVTESGTLRMSAARGRVLIAASDSGAALAGMRVQAFELGSRVVRRLVQRGFAVRAAIRADDEEFITSVRESGGTVVKLPVGRAPLDRLMGFYGRLRTAAREADLVYSMNPKLPYGAVGRCKTAITIHDFCYLEYPAEFDRLRRGYHWLNQRYLLPRADIVFTVSADAAAKLRGHFPSVAAERIVVASNGPGNAAVPVPLPAADQAVRARLGIEGAYFLFLGKLSPRKNLALIIRAVKQLLDQGVHAQVVMAGPPGWREAADWALMQELQVAPCFRPLGFVPDEDIAALLRGTAGLLYPSRCEGFGMPVLEALRLGAPVVVARGTVCADIGGRFALSVGADDVAEMSAAMQQLLHARPVPDSVLLAAHLARYDWDASATIVAERLARLLDPVPVAA